MGHGQPLAPAAPGRLASLRDNAARFSSYTTPSGQSLAIAVTPTANRPHSSKSVKRRRHATNTTDGGYCSFQDEWPRTRSRWETFCVKSSRPFRLTDVDDAVSATKPSVSWSNLDRGRRKRSTAGGSTPATTTRIVKTRQSRIRRRPYGFCPHFHSSVSSSNPLKE